MLRVRIPFDFLSERKYILSVLLGEFLDLSYHVEPVQTDRTIISNEDGRELYLSDQFFANCSEKWLHSGSLPVQPLAKWDLKQTRIDAIVVDPLIPVIYGDDPNKVDFFERSENRIDLGLDILGSSFFMLTRYEEVVKPERDKIDRFPASASLAYQEGFLDRPIVNEYLEILWWCLQDLWPALQRKKYQFQVNVSHDLDEPYLYAFTGVSRLFQRSAGDILRRGSVIQAAKSIASWYQVVRGKPEQDPYNTFDKIMDISEASNLKSAFYFITDHTAGVIDGFYSMNLPLIRQLMRKIHERGHEIGLHTSYNTYQDSQQTIKEFEILRRACEEEGIKQSTWGGRQHCLRWETPTTFQNWERAGLDYDSTLTYAENIGFRSGTCYEHSVFDIVKKQHLKLKERPLCIMDVTVTRSAYMGLNIDDGAALSAMQLIKEHCRLFNGLFSVLWHNTGFVDIKEVDLYCQIISI